MSDVTQTATPIPIDGLTTINLTDELVNDILLNSSSNWHETKVEDDTADAIMLELADLKSRVGTLTARLDGIGHDTVTTTLTVAMRELNYRLEALRNDVAEVHKSTFIADLEAQLAVVSDQTASINLMIRNDIAELHARMDSFAAFQMTTAGKLKIMEREPKPMAAVPAAVVSQNEVPVPVNAVKSAVTSATARSFAGFR
jgi:hypothetical protein